MAKPKKKYEKVLEGLSDSDDSTPVFECSICGVSYTDLKAYEKHILSKRHSKRIAERKQKAKMEKSNKEEESGSEESEDEIHCEVCDKYFTTYGSYAVHVNGIRHARNVKKQKMKKETDDMPGVIKQDNEEDDSEDDGICQKMYARCSTCQKEFNGPESYRMHLRSAKHKMKVQNEKGLENLKKDEGERSDGEEVFSKCDACNKTFSGFVPYKIHMESNVHKKKLDHKKDEEDIKEFCSNTDFSDGYTCKVCKKTYTDPKAFKRHLHDNSHEKQKAKEALSSFLNDFPEIVFATPYDKPEQGEDSKAEKSDAYFLICQVCNICFTGPESARQHVKSKKHITTKTEKQMKIRHKEEEKKLYETRETKPINKATPKEATLNGKKTSASRNSHDNSVDEFEVL